MKSLETLSVIYQLLKQHARLHEPAVRKYPYAAEKNEWISVQVPDLPLIAILIGGWLAALGFRKNHIPPDRWIFFNGTQLMLAGWTIAALTGLYQGLLGIPDMQIAGNFSSNFKLHWAQDRISSFMPRPLVISLPQWIFHLLMLFWALWLAVSLLKWLQWGWDCFSEGGIWKNMQWHRKNNL